VLCRFVSEEKVLIYVCDVDMINDGFVFEEVTYLVVDIQISCGLLDVSLWMT
jgi:hypothetical protein